jgi:hypothetical protein
MRAEAIRRAKNGLLDDDQLQQLITDRMEEDPSLWTGSGRNRTVINVQVDDGDVTLNGTVRTALDRRRAELLARALGADHGGEPAARRRRTPAPGNPASRVAALTGRRFALRRAGGPYLPATASGPSSCSPRGSRTSSRPRVGRHGGDLHLHLHRPHLPHHVHHRARALDRHRGLGQVGDPRRLAVADIIWSSPPARPVIDSPSAPMTSSWSTAFA